MRQKFIDELVETIANKKYTIEHLKDIVLTQQKRIKEHEADIPVFEQLLKDLRSGQ
jgi:uncharacterized coiled-coil protein SlyX